MSPRKIWGVVLIVTGLVLGSISVVGLLGREEPEGAQGVAAASASTPASSTAAPSATATATPSPTPTAVGAETPESFFAHFAATLRSGRIAFQLARLHPFVTDRYAEADCRAYFGGLEVPDYDVEVLAMEGTGRFRWETDDLQRLIPKATTVRIRFTEDGDTFIETDTHLVLRDGKYLFLSDCGSPKEGAR